MKIVKHIKSLAMLTASFSIAAQSALAAPIVATDTGAAGGYSYSGQYGTANGGFVVKYGVAGASFSEVDLSGPNGGSLQHTSSGALASDGTVSYESSTSATGAKGKSASWTVSGSGKAGSGGTAVVTGTKGSATVSGSKSTGFTVTKF